MNTLAVCMPPAGECGWGVCGPRIVKELRELCIVDEIRMNSGPVELNSPVLQALQGANCWPLNTLLHSTIRNVGYGFIEDSIAVRPAAAARIQFDALCCGSSWMAEMMGALSHVPMHPVPQGVDCDVFKPGVPSQKHAGKFVIFSGCKWEFRKGQDLVLRAVAHMMQKFDDVELIAAWYNPWPFTAASMQSSKHLHYKQLSERVGGTGDSIQAVMIEAGLDDYWDRIYGPISSPHAHSEMPLLIQQADVGLFCSRCEGGTNLALMETMACGVPCVATYATGHKDVLFEDSPLSLVDNKEFVYVDHTGMPRGIWYEPSLDEVIAKLEWAYFHRAELPGFGAADRESMKQFTWASTAQKLLDVCMQTK